MALSVSSRIRAHLRSTNEFTTACHVVFDYCIALIQHASVAGFNHGQFCEAVNLIYHPVALYLGGFRRILPRPPSRNRVLQEIIRRQDSEAELVLGEAEFEDFALEVFAEAMAWEMKWVLVRRTLSAAVMIGITCAICPDQSVLLAKMFAGYCLGMAALFILALRFRFIFFGLWSSRIWSFVW